MTTKKAIAEFRRAKTRHEQLMEKNRRLLEKKDRTDEELRQSASDVMKARQRWMQACNKLEALGINPETINDSSDEDRLKRTDVRIPEPPNYELKDERKETEKSEDTGWANFPHIFPII